MALFAALGFLGGMFGPFLFGLSQDLAGGRGDAVEWSAGFLSMAAGGVITIGGLWYLGREADVSPK